MTKKSWGWVWSFAGRAHDCILTPVFLLSYLIVLLVEFAFPRGLEWLAFESILIGLLILPVLSGVIAAAPLTLIALVSAKISEQIPWISDTTKLRLKIVSPMIPIIVILLTITILIPLLILGVYPIVFIWNPLFNRYMPQYYGRWNSRVYESLLKGTSLIRVLVVEPGQRSDPVRCSLQEQEVDDEAFEALSYCWATHSALRRIIYVDGRKFLVTDSVHKALRALRHTGKQRRLWIDQICINQMDDVEKSDQVANLMCKVYSCAAHVIVWLGGSSDHLARIHRASCEDVDPTEPQVMKSAQHILAQPWWERVWIVQEVLFAGEIVVQSDDTQAPWANISGYLMKYADQLHVGDLHRQLMSYRLASFDVAERPRNLLQLALHFPSRKCTDTRDTLYGLASLAADTSLTPPVDYRRDESGVFAAFVANIITHTGSCDVLALSKGTGWTSFINTGSDSTWLVDWSRLQSDTNGRIQFWRPTISKDPRFKFPEWSACGDMLADVQLLPLNEYMLQLSGVTLTKVRSVGFMSLLCNLDFDLVIGAWQEMAECKTEQAKGKFWSTLTMSAIPRDQSTEISQEQIALQTCHGRTFFVNEDGSYGLGPIDVKPGDSVCILPGARVPIVLRHRDSVFLWKAFNWQKESSAERVFWLVGGAYIHDWMFQPDFRLMVENGVFELEDFLLS